MLDKDKQYSLQDVLGVFSKALANTTAADLAEMVTENNLSSLTEVGDYVKGLVVQQKKDFGTSEFGKGRKKSAKDTERLLQKHFSSIDFDGAETQEDFFEKVATHQKAISDKSNNITLEKALQVPEVAQKFKDLKLQASKVEELQNSNSKIQRNFEILNWSIPLLEQQGAQFSKDPARRKRQVNAFLAEIDRGNFKDDGKGGYIPVNNDGDHLMNQDTEKWDSLDYLKTLTIVDFANPQDQNNSNKDTAYFPNKEQNSGGANFGFTKDSIKSFTSEDYTAALKAKEPEKAAFIKKALIENEVSRQKQE